MEAQRLLEGPAALPRSRLTRERLNQEKPAAEPVRTSAQVRDRLREGRPRGDDVALLERGPAERAEADAAKRVAIHAVGFLDGLESLEAAGSCSIAIAEPAKGLAEESRGAHRDLRRLHALEIGGLFEAPESLGARPELQMRPSETQEPPAVLRLELERSLKKRARLRVAPSRQREGARREVRREKGGRIEL